MDTLQKSLLTAREVAEYLGVSVRTVWRWNASGDLPMPMRRGRIVRWRRKDLEHFVETSATKKWADYPPRATQRPEAG